MHALARVKSKIKDDVDSGEFYVLLVQQRGMKGSKICNPLARARNKQTSWLQTLVLPSCGSCSNPRW